MPIISMCSLTSDSFSDTRMTVRNCRKKMNAKTNMSGAVISVNETNGRSTDNNLGSICTDTSGHDTDCVVNSCSMLTKTIEGLRETTE